MKINFTKKQYKLLLDLVYLGEWTANASRTAGNNYKEYEEMFEYICSFAKDFGYDDVIEYDNKLGDYFPTREYEESLEPLIEENDDNVFWNQLPSRLASRDIDRMGKLFQSQEEHMKKFFEIQGKYEEEFNENGIENLVIKK